MWKSVFVIMMYVGIVTFSCAGANHYIKTGNIGLSWDFMEPKIENCKK